MAAAVAVRSSGLDKHSMDSGKYVRYTSEQVEALERVYAECPKPSSARRQQVIRDFPVLANIEPKQIKVWFQNRRCREKQRKESSRLLSVNRKLTAMNKLLMEENERLQKQVAQLVHENAHMRQQLQKVSLANDTSCESVVTTPQNSLRDANSPAGLMSIAEETLAGFLSKATGTAVDWVQLPGMKPGPDSIGIVAISDTCSGVAARACGLVTLEPTKISEVLKDRPTWLPECRSLEVLNVIATRNGGKIELMYMQMYAPTTLALARDFWTLRYTTNLQDGSLVVCERSLTGSGKSPAQQFVRAEMLPSGFLIRPCDGGGSIVHIVDHIDLEASSVPEVLRPLYESSRVLALKMTTTALRHIRQIAQEMTGDIVHPLGRQPALLRAFSQKLSRGFNDAINGFNDDGWSLMKGDGAEDVILTINSNKRIGAMEGVICAKASMLIQNVPPALLVRFLREHRSEWADYIVDAYFAASLRSGASSGSQHTRFSGSQIIMPLGHTVENEEFLEVVRLEGQAFGQDNSPLKDVHLLQLCSGIDEKSMGVCYQLVFATINELFPDDALLLPSGFRVLPLNANTDSLPSNRTLDLASSLEVGSFTNCAAGKTIPENNDSRSVLTIAFQFPYEAQLQDSVAAMARQYLRSIVSAVQRVSMAITSQSGLNVGQKLLAGFPEAVTLARWICRSYNYHLGLDLVGHHDETQEALLKTLWHHSDAILCCSFQSQPSFTFANQTGLDMLETTLMALQDITLDKMFEEPGRKELYTELAKLMEQGYAHLPAGVCLSGMGRHVSYEQAVIWKVLDEENSVHCLAMCFFNWTFL